MLCNDRCLKFNISIYFLNVVYPINPLPSYRRRAFSLRRCMASLEGVAVAMKPFGVATASQFMLGVELEAVGI